MGNELRQAYKAVCTNISSVSSSEWVKIIDIADNSYVRVYCYVGSDFVKLSLMSGRKPEQIGYATNKNIKIKYSDSENIVYLQPASGPANVSVKTEIIYGTVNNFPSNVGTNASGTDFKLADSRGIIKIENGDDGNQKITAPGGIAMANASGTFGTLVASSLNINNEQLLVSNDTTSSKSLDVSGDAKFKTNITVGGTITAGAMNIGNSSLETYIINAVKNNLLYDGSYLQN